MKSNYTAQSQVYRKDGKDCFVEVLTSSFEIGKVILNFVSYDKSKAANSRVTGTIPIYLDFADFLALASQVQSGLLAKKIQYVKDQASLKKEKYPAPAYAKLGGTPHHKQKNKREDGAAESRRFFIKPSTKSAFYLSSEKGKGKEDPQTKLIIPQGPAEKIISIAFSDEEMRALVAITTLHIQSYVMKQWMSDMWIASNQTLNGNGNASANSTHNGDFEIPLPEEPLYLSRRAG